MTGIGKRIDVSFEFFPTSTEVGRTNLVGCVEELAPLEPTFFSVTYGAGGSTRDRTHATIASVRDNTDVTVAGHLTCVASSRTEVQAVLDQYRNAGLSRIVALRGDDPADYDPSKIVDGYSDAAALVAGIRQRVDGDLFDLSVGAYPEVHPRAESAQSDLDNLKRKIDAGADRAITQFFFDTDAFLRFHGPSTSRRHNGPDHPRNHAADKLRSCCRFRRALRHCRTTVAPRPVWRPRRLPGSSS